MDSSAHIPVAEPSGVVVDPSTELPSAPHNAGDTAGDESKSGHDGDAKRKRGGGKQRPKLDRDRHLKKGNMGRKEYFRNDPDKRQRNDEQAAKRQKLADDGKSQPAYFNFSKEEIEAEDRRPKRKVAILIGYSGTGYKGMQISPVEKTIEGDLFAAFIKTGAISKANANDPKKSGLVRCARTDKGVHAAGNVINLKLIIEDPDVMQKINEQLPPQIRIWHIQRTTGSFNCYQLCDSRWYEYLIPSHSFLPPHPSTYLAKKLVEYATEAGDLEEHQKRQQEVAGWWEEAEEKFIKPVLDQLDESIRSQVIQAMYDVDSISDEPVAPPKNEDDADSGNPTDSTETPEEREARIAARKALDAAVKQLRQAYWTAKESYRISPERIARIKETLSLYCGTKNYHNFTVRKSAKDPSAKRHIKSFIVNETPIVINGTEWLSLKVHGQSFMMHQIRKMVGMASLVVRCGSDPNRVYEALGNDVFNIPKAPGLGLLLERPVFDHYNSKAAQFGRDKIDFDIVQKEMDDFKQREIYDRIFREEMESHTFHAFFTHIDNFKRDLFLYLTSKGLAAASVPQGQKRGREDQKAKDAAERELIDSDDDDDDPKVGEGTEG